MPQLNVLELMPKESELGAQLVALEKIYKHTDYQLLRYPNFYPYLFIGSKSLVLSDKLSLEAATLSLVLG